jgi:amino acid transporter
LSAETGTDSLVAEVPAAAVPAASSSGLHRRLTAFDALLLTLSCLSPAFSVYGPGSDVLQHAGSGAAMLFLIGIAAAAIWGIVYAEFGSAFPYAGGDYVGVGAVLGPAAGFACLAVWAVFVVPITAYLAIMVGTYVEEVIPAVSAQSVTVGSLALATGIALLAVRTNALLTGIFLAIEMSAVLALVVAGLWHPPSSLAILMHPLIPSGSGQWVPVTSAAMAMGAVSAAFATAGGNQAIAFGEELIDPHRKMGRVIIVACLAGALAIALPVMLVAWNADRYAAIFRSAAPFSAFISRIAGPTAGRALSAAVALAVFNALIAQLLFAARLFFSFARDGVFPSRINAALAKVHGASGAPRVATVVVAAGSALCCLLGSHLILVFVSGMVVYGLGFVSLAVLVGRLRGQTGSPGFWRSPCYPLVPILGLALALAFAVAEWADPEAGRPSLIALGALLVAAVAWYRYVLSRRPGGWAPRVQKSMPDSSPQGNHT